jgi:hypothetical protein
MRNFERHKPKKMEMKDELTIALKIIYQRCLMLSIEICNTRFIKFAAFDYASSLILQSLLDYPKQN